MDDMLSILIKGKLDTSDLTQAKINQNEKLKNLNVKLKATLDLSKESVAKFKEDVRKLAEKSKINLKVGIDKQSVKQAEKSAKDMKTNIAKNSSVDLPIFNKTVLEREGREFFARTNDIVDRVKKRYASMGDVNVNLFKNAQGQVTNFTAEIKKADGVIEKFKFNLAKLEGYTRSQKGFVYSGANLIDKNAGDNLIKTLDKLQLYQNKIDKLQAGFTSPITGVKEQENLTALTNKYTQIKNSIDQARLAGTKLTDEQRRGILQNINSLEIEIKRYRDLERIMRTSNTRSLSQDDIALYQETMRDKLANLSIGKTDTVFRRPEIIAEMDRFNNSLTRVGTVGGESVRRVNLQFSKLSTAVRRASAEISRINSQADSLGTTFSKDIFKLGIWAAAATAMYAPLRALRDGLQTLKEIDTELINIAKVTEYTNYEMQKLVGTAVNAGKEFGRTAQEYLQAVTEFSRAGFGQQAQEYGKLSLLLQNVGDVNAETANATLIAANAGFQLGGSYESLMGVIDKFNNVSNKNATTVTKLSEAMKVGASVFHSAGMSMDETVAIIGTATSSTQRAGSEIK